ncbi:NAD(P)/FAD-dependent oxidoreductase, partial [Bacillus pumilus]
VHYSKTIIITAGNGAFQPRKLELDAAESFEGSNLHYFINDLNQFAGRRVAVLGGGDSAVDWALMLEPIAKEVSIIHRRDKFRAHEHSVENLHNSKVNVLTPFVPTELIGEDRIEQIVLEEVKGDKKQVLD